MPNQGHLIRLVSVWISCTSYYEDLVSEA